ncbi:MAG TPA: hypothetical protein DF774_08975 [Rheinheimera sp.]|nr:hypothetical protein [Rheinheimera sp.]
MVNYPDKYKFCAGTSGRAHGLCRFAARDQNTGCKCRSETQGLAENKQKKAGHKAGFNLAVFLPFH